jgi:hypothetical protein
MEKFMRLGVLLVVFLSPVVLTMVWKKKLE